MTDAEQVAFHLGPDGQAAFILLTEEDADLQATMVSAALSTYRDARLAAAYLLDVLAAAQRQTASTAPTGTKRIKVAKIEIEKALGGPGLAATLAEIFTERAKLLRRESRKSQGIVFATPLQVLR
ncbi:hypothetical protein [Deinococcus sp. QL22]|uniref:hypothetical protein n=1 Tax=Deinococcus sp. QL22 TaxID=2939437 RepID=UPI0020181732|nr:hypothetical protein [Deinococcus sp. QL22]UQN06767.1 hypothetical protein M1R55_02265 [Deinococcus sp. QL22]